MRFKSRGVLLALVAVFAMSAIAASAASAALPEFKPVPTKKKLTSSSGTVVWRYATNYIECAKSTSTGEITSASTLGKVVIKFTGCKMLSKEGVECGSFKSTNSSNEGEIITYALKGELGTVKTTEAASGAGLLLEPESGRVLFYNAAVSGCEWPEGIFEGNVAGEVSPVGKKQLTSTLVLAPSAAKGIKQKIKEITVKRGLVKPKITSYGAAEMAIEASDTTTFEEALEVT